MLPLTHRDRNGFLTRLNDTVKSWIRLIYADHNTRNIFLFLMLNISFAFVELFYGVWTNSLGLISDAFHMFFDCTGLAAGLVASVISKWKANEQYTYGYGRAEVLAGFANGLFLLFIAFFIMSEAVERAIEPPEVKHERLFIVSVLGLIVNLIGIYSFQHGHSSHGTSHGHSHSLTTRNGSIPTGDLSMDTRLGGRNSQIMKGMFLHVLADTLGSVGVIVSAILMHMFGWMRADPICSMFIAVLIAISVLSLLRESTMILMQRQPVLLDDVLPKCYQMVSGLAGVYSVQEHHFWTIYGGEYVGTVKLEVSKNIDPKYVVVQTQKCFRSVGVKHLCVQLDYLSM